MNRTAAALLLLFLPLQAAAQVSLTGGTSARFRDRPGSEQDSASIKFVSQSFPTVTSPLCPTLSTLQLRPDNGPGRSIPLDCRKWRPSQGGFIYRDRAASRASVTKVTYTSNKLVILIKGSAEATLRGPLATLEAGFVVGASSYCARFTTFPSNTATQVQASGPTGACVAAGAPGFREASPGDSECPTGFDCAAFAVQPGVGGVHPDDDGHSSWFRITNLVPAFFVVDNGTNGTFGGDRLILAKGQQLDANGRADLRLVKPVIVGAPFPFVSRLSGSVCFRITPDPTSQGFIDCDGGSATNTEISLDSHGTNADDAPQISIGGDGGERGAALVRVRIQAATTASNDVPCSQADFSSVPFVDTAITTALGTTKIANPRQRETSPRSYPDATLSTSLGGRALSCDDWRAGQRATMVAPLFALNSANGSLPGLYDLAEVLRLELLAGAAGAAAVAAIGIPSVTPTLSPKPTAGVAPTPVSVNCPDGSTCAAFNIVPGPGVLLPVNDGTNTWLRIFDFTGSGIFGNATDGAFGPSPIVLSKDSSNPGGVAVLTWLGVSYLGASFLSEAQQLGQAGTICIRIQQDPAHEGWIDCDGGTNADVSLSIDSQLGKAPPPNPLPMLTAASAAQSSAPAGSGLLPVLTQFTVVGTNQADCSRADYSAAPVVATAFTTAGATSHVANDWVNGAGPQAAGSNTTSLSGVPFSCADWGSVSGTNVSIAAPLFALDFVAPILGTTVDVAEVFRLNLQPRTLPNVNDTPTPAPSPTNTSMPTPSATVTNTLPPSPTSTKTASMTRTATATRSATATASPTPLGPMLRNVVITNETTDFGVDYQALGNCYQAGGALGTVGTQTDTSFETRFQTSVATDCEAVPTGGGGIQAALSSAYTIHFDVVCPAGAPYILTVSSSLNGAFTINRDNGDGCDLPFFGDTGISTASVSTIAGQQRGGQLSSGTLDVSAPGSLSSATDSNSGFTRNASAAISGVASGSPQAHTLSFAWVSTCSSSGDSTDTGAECAVRLGIESNLDPNGILACSDADDYPGVGGRHAHRDGHLVTVHGSCGIAPPPAGTATAAPSITPGGPTLTPTATPSSTPIRTALGRLNFTIISGPGGSDMAPGCPTEPSSGSFLKADGNPTGGAISGKICNGTKGDFYSSAALQLAGGTPDGNGVAALTITAPIVVGASLPSTTPNCSNCDACWRIEQGSAAGFIDCDGGTGSDVLLTIASNVNSPPPAPGSGPYVLGGSNGGAGAAILRASVKRLRVSGRCPDVADGAWNSVPASSALLVTGNATARIDSPRCCSGSAIDGTSCPASNPYQVVLSGANLNCANWNSNSGGKFVVPFQNLDEPIGGSFGAGDIAQVLRLQD